MLWITCTYITIFLHYNIYLYEVDGNPTPCDEFDILMLLKEKDYSKAIQMGLLGILEIWVEGLFIFGEHW